MLICRPVNMYASCLYLLTGLCWTHFKASRLQGFLLHLQCKSLRLVITHDCSIILCIASPLSFSIFFRWLSSANDFNQFKLNASCDLWWSRLPTLILASLSFFRSSDTPKWKAETEHFWHTGLKIENDHYKIAFVWENYVNDFNIFI